MQRIRFFLSLGLIIIFSMVVALSRKVATPIYMYRNETMVFSGQRALADAVEQVNLGPRTPDSKAHAIFLNWLQSKIIQTGWQVSHQTGTFQGHTINNIVAQNSNAPPQIIIAAHYDSRLLSDNDPDPNLRSNPVPGANDGASGVAVLLELARTIPDKSLPIWLVFLDAEDNGNIPGWEWLLGSRYFVSMLETKPQAVILLDMIGDENLNIHIERNSNIELSDEIWSTAQLLGYEKNFINTPKYSIIDDHIPFIEAGIPAVDIIDFDYPYWHTTADTIDKISADSLAIVGSTILFWINQQN